MTAIICTALICAAVVFIALTRVWVATINADIQASIRRTSENLATISEAMRDVSLRLRGLHIAQNFYPKSDNVAPFGRNPSPSTTDDPKGAA